MTDIDQAVYEPKLSALLENPLSEQRLRLLAELLKKSRYIAPVLGVRSGLIVGTTQQELSEDLNQHQPNVARNLKALEQLGWIETLMSDPTYGSQFRLNSERFHKAK